MGAFLFDLLAHIRQKLMADTFFESKTLSLAMFGEQIIQQSSVEKYLKKQRAPNLSEIKLGALHITS